MIIRVWWSLSVLRAPTLAARGAVGRARRRRDRPRVGVERTCVAPVPRGNGRMFGDGGARCAVDHRDPAAPPPFPGWLGSLWTLPGALSELCTAGAVVVDRHAVGGVAGASFRDGAVVGGLGAVEPLEAVRGVAERLVAGAAAAAQAPDAAGAQQGSGGVVDGDVAADPVGPMLGDVDTALGPAVFCMFVIRRRASSTGGAPTARPEYCCWQAMSSGVWMNPRLTRWSADHRDGSRGSDSASNSTRPPSRLDGDLYAVRGGLVVGGSSEAQNPPGQPSLELTVGFVTTMSTRLALDVVRSTHRW